MIVEENVNVIFQKPKDSDELRPRIRVKSFLVTKTFYSERKTSKKKISQKSYKLKTKITLKKKKKEE